MPESSNFVQHDEGDDGAHWRVDHCAVAAERLTSSNGAVRAVMLRHPTYPFRGRVDGADLERGLRRIATAYLEAIRERAAIPQAVLDALASDDPAFGWLPIAWGDDALAPARRDPRQSFWVVRGAGTIVDRTCVLLAGERIGEGFSAGGEIGARVVLHVGPVGTNGTADVRVTGVSTSDLASAVRSKDFPPKERVDTLSLIQSLIAPRLNLGGQLAIHGFQTIAGKRFRLFGVGIRRPSASDGPTARTFSFVNEVEVVGDALQSRSIGLVERTTEATVSVFARDPASCGRSESAVQRRPTRDAAVLDTHRSSTSRLPAPDKPDERPLSDPRGYFEVRQSPLGNALAQPDSVQVIPDLALDLRSDHLAAAHAYARGAELFERFTAYGLAPASYFKFAALPLVLRHHAPLVGAGDGNAVNARVRPLEVGPSFLDPWRDTVSGQASGAGGSGVAMPQLEVSFGAADLSRRAMLPNDDGRLRAQALGLAADPRWAWHEFGHVLNFASFGALEFRFAHAAGDALAAIVADPDSDLATDPFARYATFPWVFIPRRHDRDAASGWCWCGRRNRPRLAGADAHRDRKFGYFEEQLMSSSLFRFYRAIGGDTHDAGPNATNKPVRRSAADYAVYLVMRALALLGPEAVVPARTPDQLVAALIDADIGTQEWAITAAWPEHEPARYERRVGGCVHKVIRWAFEQQGLYATDDSSAAVEGVGRPPIVDIFVADARRGAAPADGGYHPVPLAWSDTTPQPWHASAEGIDVDADTVSVRVGNRGRLTAENVSVTVWIAAAPTRAGNGAGNGSVVWSPLVGTDVQDVPVGATTLFSSTLPAGLVRPGIYFVRASATCVADRSNADPCAHLPCGKIEPSLIELIANDNNQGLRIVELI